MLYGHRAYLEDGSEATEAHCANRRVELGPIPRCAGLSQKGAYGIRTCLQNGHFSRSG